MLTLHSLNLGEICNCRIFATLKFTNKVSGIFYQLDDGVFINIMSLFPSELLFTKNNWLSFASVTLNSLGRILYQFSKTILIELLIFPLTDAGCILIICNHQYH